MADLKPCPFCGNRAILRTGSDADNKLQWAVVSCDFTQPGHCDSIDPHATEADAIAAWNRRAPLAPPTEAEVEAAARTIASNRGWDWEGGTQPTTRQQLRDDARTALAAFVAGRTGG